MVDSLTHRETEILVAIKGGQNSKQVAATFGIAITTVTWHLVNIYTKLGANNRAHAVAIALDAGLLDSEG